MKIEQVSEAVNIRTASSFPYCDKRPANSKDCHITASGFCKEEFNPFLKTAIRLGDYVEIDYVVKDLVLNAYLPSVLVVQWVYECKVNQLPQWLFEGWADGVFEDFGNQI